MWNGRYLLIPPLQCVQCPVIPILFIIVIEQSQDHPIEFDVAEDAIF
jgi:hypothetical protein